MSICNLFSYLQALPTPALPVARRLAVGLLVGSLILGMATTMANLAVIGSAHAQVAGAVGPRWIFRAPDDPTNVAPLFVQIVIEEGVAALTDPVGGRTDRREIFLDIFRRSFATDDIGRLVLADYWDSSPSHQRALFLEALGNHLAKVVINDLPDGRFVVRGATMTGATSFGAPRTEVITVFVGQNFSARVPWVLAIVDEELKILDITFAGNSFLLDRRREFARILQRNGGSMDALIAELNR